MPCQLPKHFLNVPIATDNEEDTEWDSVIFCKKPGDHLPTVFLVQEIKSDDFAMINRMQMRINHTRKFIVTCKTTPPANIECYEKKLVSVWAAFNNCTIRGVFGAPSFTDSQITEIDDSSFMRINYIPTNQRSIEIYERGTKRSEINLAVCGDVSCEERSKSSLYLI